MALFYLDTSALVKLFVQEPGSERLLAIASSEQRHTLGLLALAAVEFRSAIRRREREGDIESFAAAEMIRCFERHQQAKFLVQPVTDAVLETALHLIDKYVLRAYDALQLGGCLTLRAVQTQDPLVFVCADQRLLEAARNEGLSVEDPALFTA